MNEVNLTDYCCAGYVIIKRINNLDMAKFDTLNVLGSIVSIDEGICPGIPGSWLINWIKSDDSISSSAKEIYGLGSEKESKLSDFLTTSLDENFIGFPNVSYSLNFIRKILKEFQLNSQIIIIGFGLHKDDIYDFIYGAKPNPGELGLGAYYSLTFRKEFFPGGSVLGFEPLGYDYFDLESWCYFGGLHKEIFNIFNIGTNDDGLINNYSDAREASKYAQTPEAGTHEGIWFPWLLVEYPLEGMDEGEAFPIEFAERIKMKFFER